MSEKLHAVEAGPETDPMRAFGTLEQVYAGLRSLAESGPPSAIVERVPAEAGKALGLERVILSSVKSGQMIPEAIHLAADPASEKDTLLGIRSRAVDLAYPLKEADLLRRRKAGLVRLAANGSDSRSGFPLSPEPTEYVAAPVVVAARVIGFIHGDRAGSLDDMDRDFLERFAEGFGLVFERAVLRRRLRVQQQEWRRIASWADSRTGELNDAEITMAAGHEDLGSHIAPDPPAISNRLQGLLTPREIEVLEQLARGGTNADIARELVVSSGTVKFHVKNILRKLNAANRAEAATRYHQLNSRSEMSRGPVTLPEG